MKSRKIERVNLKFFQIMNIILYAISGFLKKTDL